MLWSPASAARWRGVRPSLSTRLGSAPAFSSTSTTFTCRVITARCRGVCRGGGVSGHVIRMFGASCSALTCPTGVCSVLRSEHKLSKQEKLPRTLPAHLKTPDLPVSAYLSSDCS